MYHNLQETFNAHAIIRTFNTYIFKGHLNIQGALIHIRFIKDIHVFIKDTYDAHIHIYKRLHYITLSTYSCTFTTYSFTLKDQ